MSWAEYRPLVADYCAQAGLPGTAAHYIAAWKNQLTSMAAARVEDPTVLALIADLICTQQEDRDDQEGSEG